MPVELSLRIEVPIFKGRVISGTQLLQSIDHDFLTMK